MKLQTINIDNALCKGNRRKVDVHVQTDARSKMNEQINKDVILSTRFRLAVGLVNVKRLVNTMAEEI